MIKKPYQRLFGPEKVQKQSRKLSGLRSRDREKSGRRPSCAPTQSKTSEQLLTFEARAFVHFALSSDEV